jgi:hypothetical protein
MQTYDAGDNLLKSTTFNESQALVDAVSEAVADPKVHKIRITKLTDPPQSAFNANNHTKARAKAKRRQANKTNRRNS